MARMIEVHEQGDTIVTMAKDGDVRIWVVDQHGIPAEVTGLKAWAAITEAS